MGNLAFKLLYFAYNSIDLVKLAETEHKKHIAKNLSEHAKIDTICVLDK